MKKLILLLLLVGCKKQQTKPNTQQPAQTNVWCFYQTNFGNKAFLDCAKSESEYNTKVGQYNGLHYIVEVKSNCNDCQ